MNLLAHLAIAASDTALAGLAHSELAYQKPGGGVNPAKGGCTPCAAAARLEAAQKAVATASGRGPLPRRPRKVASTP